MSLHDALLREFTITRPTPDLLDVMPAAPPDARRNAMPCRPCATAKTARAICRFSTCFASFRPPVPPPATLSRPFRRSRRGFTRSPRPLRPIPDRCISPWARCVLKTQWARAAAASRQLSFADRFGRARRVRVFIHPSHKFGLPDGDKPVIMVGPARASPRSGRSFRNGPPRERRAKTGSSSATSAKSCDFLYRDELERYQADGVLTRLDTAFSRDSDKKVYVQNRMLEQPPSSGSGFRKARISTSAAMPSAWPPTSTRPCGRSIAEQGGHVGG